LNLRRLIASPDFRAWLLLAVIVFVFFAPAATLQGVYFFGDATDYYARLAYSAARLRSGELALWNPYLSLGGSQAADPAALAWYPVNLLLFLLLPASFAYNYTVFLHVLLAGSSAYLLARTWRQTPTAALLSGIVYALNGFLIAHLQHLNILVGVAWLPLLFYFVQQFHTTRRGIFLVGGSFTLALQILGGHTQIVLYGGLALAAFVLVLLIQLWVGNQRARMWREAAGFVGLVAGAVGLAAIFVVPFVELLNFTTRSGGVTFDYATTFSLVPERLVTFLFPFAFGGSIWRPESGSGSLIEMSAYTSILGLVLAPLGITRKDWHTLFLAALGLVALLLALGSYTPIYALVFRLPLLGSVRAPARFLADVVFALTFLSGFGLDALRRRTATRRTWIISAGLALLALLTTILILTSRVRAELPHVLNRLGTFAPDTLAALFFILSAAVVLALGARGILPERMLLALMLALVTADLFFFNYNFVYNRLTSPAVYSKPSPTAQRIRADSPASCFYYSARGEPKLASYLQQRDLTAYVTLSREGLRQSLPMDFGLCSLQGYGSEPPAYSDWTGAIDSSGSFDASAARLLGMFGGRYVLTRSTLDSASLQLVLTVGDIKLYLNRQDLGRVRLVRQAESVVDQRAALAAIERPDFDPARTVVLEAASLDLNGTDGAARATVRLARPEYIEVATQSASAGYLVLNDTYYPGWVATVDGQPAPIYRANGLVRAVPVPAGSHTVEFVYSPTSVKIGAAISGVTLFMLLLILTRVGRH
jgi:Bacterial membrane protein YfhO